MTKANSVLDTLMTKDEAATHFKAIVEREAAGQQRPGDAETLRAAMLELGRTSDDVRRDVATLREIARLEQAIRDQEGPAFEASRKVTAEREAFEAEERKIKADLDRRRVEIAGRQSAVTRRVQDLTGMQVQIGNLRREFKAATGPAVAPTPPAPLTEIQDLGLVSATVTPEEAERQLLRPGENEIQNLSGV